MAQSKVGAVFSYPMTPKALLRRLASAAASFLLLTATAGAATAQEPLLEELVAGTFVEALEVNLVSVEVYVADKEGKPVTGLTARDFEVREDGKKVAVSNFSRIGGSAEPSAAGAPGGARTSHFMVLFFDNFTLAPATRRQAVEALRGAIHRRRETGLVYAVVTYDGRLDVVLPFTDDPDVVLDALRDMDAVSPLGALRQQQRTAALRDGLQMLNDIRQLTRSEVKDTEVPRYIEEYSRQIDMHASRLEQVNAASFYAMSHLANALAALPGRKAVIYVSEGLPARPGDELYEALARTLEAVQTTLLEDLTIVPGSEEADAALAVRSSRLDAIESRGRGRRSATKKGTPNGTLRMLTALANASSVSFYAYKGQRDGGGAPAEFSGAGADLDIPWIQGLSETNLSDTLRMLAEETGGAAFVGGDVDALVEQASADFADYYSLGYQAPHPGDGQFHAIKVKVKGPKVKGRGLRVRHRTGYVAKPLPVKVADRTSTALLLGLDHNPLSLDLEVGPGRRDPDGKHWIVPVSLIVPLAGVTLISEKGGVSALNAQVYIAARSAAGDLAPVQEATLHIEVPTAELEEARRGVHATGFQLELREGRQRLAVGLVDPLAAVSSFVSRDIVVGDGDGDGDGRQP